MQSDCPSPEKRFDLAAIGETMVAFVSRDDPHHYLAVPAGAESNVAIGMARLGCRTQWVSRLGADPLGRFVEESVSDAGVMVEVVRDDARPTGVMTIHVDGVSRSSTYYRSESAARTLSPEDLRRVSPSRWTHLTGITPALSDSAFALVESVMEDRRGDDALVSFDVNFRPALWPSTEMARRTLLRVARAADVVFIGDDECQALVGTSDVVALADSILERADQELVLKRGAGPASAVTASREISEPALQTAVVEPTGAGDAFAAGYLAARVFGWPTPARLRLGHLMGSRTVGVLEHVPPRFTASEFAAITPAGLAELWESSPGIRRP